MAAALQGHTYEGHSNQPLLIESSEWVLELWHAQKGSPGGLVKNADSCLLSSETLIQEAHGKAPKSAFLLRFPEDSMQVASRLQLEKSLKKKCM